MHVSYVFFCQSLNIDDIVGRTLEKYIGGAGFPPSTVAHKNFCSEKGQCHRKKRTRRGEDHTLSIIDGG